MKKKTLEYAKEKFNEIGLILDSIEYKSVDTPMICHDKEGYFYCRTLRTAEKVIPVTKGNYSHRFSTKNKFYWENIQHFMDVEVKNGTKLLTEKRDFKNGDSLIVFQCGECGLPFKKSFHSFIHLDNKICQSCFKKYYKEQSHILDRRNDAQKYCKILKEKSYTYLFGSMSNIKEKIDVEDKEGYRGRITLSTLYREVDFDRFSIKNPYSLYNIRHYVKINEIPVNIPDQIYKGNDVPIEVICSCGKMFKRTFYHCMHDNSWRCDECRASISTIALKVENYLKSLNTNYLKEHSFDGCFGDKKLLHFDFFIPHIKKVIEVDGIQHYKPIQFGGISIDKAKENYKTCKRYDEIKNRFCKDNGIPLLRIPFWEIENSDNYKILIDKFLSLQD